MKQSQIKLIFIAFLFLLDTFASYSQSRPPENYTGAWVTRDTSGNIYSVLNYLNGIEDGEATWYFENNEVRTHGKYVNGKQEGEWIYNQKNGGREKANYLNGKMHGDWTLYYKNGKIQQKNYYINGKIVGEGVFYYENGIISCRQTTENDYFISIIEYDSLGSLKKGKYISVFDTPNGKMTLEGMYKNGSLNGEAKYFDEKGIVIGKGNFKNGVCDGEQLWYFPNGKIKSRSKFVAGKEIEKKEYDEFGNVKHQ